MKINVYCKDKGWLFEDLKNTIALKGATPSEKPLSGFDKYICIRTKEANLSPNPKKTVVQVHDMATYDLRDYGKISLVHESQAQNVKGSMEITPIGSRMLRRSCLPEKPTIGFFCREVGDNKKGSDIFEKAVLKAKKKIEFDVLMIGQRLEHISHLGKYENRPANIDDYDRITALFVASKTPMIPLSAYETLASGKAVISTPRLWPDTYSAVKEGRTLNDLSENIINVVENPKLYHTEMRFWRDSWAKRQIELAKAL